MTDQWASQVRDGGYGPVVLGRYILLVLTFHSCHPPKFQASVGGASFYFIFKNTSTASWRIRIRFPALTAASHLVTNPDINCSSSDLQEFGELVRGIQAFNSVEMGHRCSLIVI